MQTQQKVPTPMYRMKEHMTALRQEMLRLGFRQVSLNKAKGQYYDGGIIGVVSSDYTEFFSTENIALTKHEKKHNTDHNIHFFGTWGFSFSYKNLSKSEQTVKLQYKKRTKFRDNGKNLITNSTINSEETTALPVEKMLEHLPKLIAMLKEAKTTDETFSAVRSLIKELQ